VGNEIRELVGELACLRIVIEGCGKAEIRGRASY
jgi:hypothetical protein